MWIDKETNMSYNFIAPKDQEKKEKITEVPFPLSELITPNTSGSTVSVTVNAEKTIIDLGSLNKSIGLYVQTGKNIRVGSVVVVKAESTDSSSILYKDGIWSSDLEINENELGVQEFIYDGIKFIATGEGIHYDK
jgi:hypothetical protein